MKQAEISLVQSRQSAISTWMASENTFFTSVLEESITNKQTLLLTQAVVSFSVLVGSSFLSVIAALVCLVWFGVSLHLCVKGGLHE